MSNKGGTNKACAACKYQRRRCSKDCLLSPYFPADKPKTFSNAHRLFGVCNMLRILKQVEPDEKDEAMKSIIFESDMRARFPVFGCYGVMVHYQNRLARAMEELRYVQMLLAYFKQQSQEQRHPLPLVPMDPCSVLPTTSEVFPLYNGNVACDSWSYIESNDNAMNKYSCSSVISHVDASHKEDRSNSMSMHEQFHNKDLDIPLAVTNFSTNAVDTKPSKSISWAVQGQSHHNGKHIYLDCSNASAITHVSANPINANPNLRSIQGIPLHKELHIPHVITKVNANSMDSKFSKLKSIAVQGQSYHNEYDMFDYDDALFDEFDHDRQPFIGCKDAC